MPVRIVRAKNKETAYLGISKEVLGLIPDSEVGHIYIWLESLSKAWGFPYKDETQILSVIDILKCKTCEYLILDRCIDAKMECTHALTPKYCEDFFTSEPQRGCWYYHESKNGKA